LYSPCEAPSPPKRFFLLLCHLPRKPPLTSTPLACASISTPIIPHYTTAHTPLHALITA
jgi:hypothetical protein